MTVPPLFIICGPPGVGKGTVLGRIAADTVLRLTRVLSVTTRPPRAGERNGVDYHFISSDAFEDLRRAGELFGGTRKQFGFDYGIRRRDIDGPRGRGTAVIAESNPHGAALATASFENVVTVFLLPPSESELRRRLVARASDDAAGLKLRVLDGREMLANRDVYSIDHFVVNDDLDRCLSEIRDIVRDSMPLSMTRKSPTELVTSSR